MSGEHNILWFGAVYIVPNSVRQDMLRAHAPAATFDLSISLRSQDFLMYTLYTKSKPQWVVVGCRLAGFFGRFFDDRQALATIVTMPCARNRWYFAVSPDAAARLRCAHF